MANKYLYCKNPISIRSAQADQQIPTLVVSREHLVDVDEVVSLLKSINAETVYIDGCITTRCLSNLSEEPLESSAITKSIKESSLKSDILHINIVAENIDGFGYIKNGEPYSPNLLKEDLAGRIGIKPQDFVRLISKKSVASDLLYLDSKDNIHEDYSPANRGVTYCFVRDPEFASENSEALTSGRRSTETDPDFVPILSEIKQSSLLLNQTEKIASDKTLSFVARQIIKPHIKRAQEAFDLGVNADINLDTGYVCFENQTNGKHVELNEENSTRLIKTIKALLNGYTDSENIEHPGLNGTDMASTAEIVALGLEFKNEIKAELMEDFTLTPDLR